MTTGKTASQEQDLRTALERAEASLQYYVTLSPDGPGSSSAYQSLERIRAALSPPRPEHAGGDAAPDKAGAREGVEDDAGFMHTAETSIAWRDSAMQFSRNEDFYRSLVVQIGEMFGVAAKTSDDGSVQQDVLALKVPELVAAALAPKPTGAEAGRGVVPDGYSGLTWDSPIDLPPDAGRGLAGRIMDAAWPEFGGNNLPAEFWRAFDLAIRFTLATTPTPPVSPSPDSMAPAGAEAHRKRVVALARKIEDLGGLHDGTFTDIGILELSAALTPSAPIASTEACNAAWYEYRVGTPENRGPGWNDPSPASAWKAAWKACEAHLASAPIAAPVREDGAREVTRADLDACMAILGRIADEGSYTAFEPQERYAMLNSALLRIIGLLGAGGPRLQAVERRFSHLPAPASAVPGEATSQEGEL